MYTEIEKALSPKTAFLYVYFLFNFTMPSGHKEKLMMQ